MEWADPPVLPTIQLPTLELPRPVLEVPRAELPSYKPIVVPPSDLRPPPGVKGPEPEEQPERREQPKPPPPTPPIPPQLPKEIRYIEVPGIDQPIPIPTNEVLATAGTTATVSVAAGLVATSIFKRVVAAMKPVIKKILTKKQKNAES